MIMKQINTFLLIIIAITFYTPVKAKNYSCTKWEVFDIPFKAVTVSINPFTAEFTGVFIHESGKEMNIPGFYNGSNTWIIRFSPSLEGEWTYTTHSDFAALDHKKGKVMVTPNDKKDRHGAVVINEKNSQRFMYEDGTSYFPLAFEIDWLFALDAQNKEGIPKTEKIVNSLVEHKFNKLIMNVYAYDASWGEKEKIDPKYNFANPEIFPFGGTNDNPDHSTLNIDFFNHFDRVMRHLHENELVSHLMIYVWNKKVNWAKPGSEQDNMYFDYVVKRYQAFPNLIWDISKEALAYGMDDMDYIAERIERLNKLDGHDRLLTVHDYSFCRAYPGLVDFISIQEWKPNLYDQMIRVAETHPQKPVFNVEHGGYEKSMHEIFHGAYIDPVVCLERTYTCIFAGTYSTYYWQNSSWYELVYEPFELPEENQPKFIYYKILMEFFSNFDYGQFSPDQFFYSSYCLSNEKDVFLYFMPCGMYALEGMPPKPADKKRVSIQWFDPLNGSYTEKEERTLNGWSGFVKPKSIDSPFAIVIMRVLNEE